MDPDVKQQRGADGPHVVPCGQFDGPHTRPPLLVMVVHGERPAPAGAQVEHLDGAVTPVDADLMVLERLVNDLAGERDIVPGATLGRDRGAERRHIFGDAERLRRSTGRSGGRRP